MEMEAGAKDSPFNNILHGGTALCSGPMIELVPLKHTSAKMKTEIFPEEYEAPCRS